MTNTGSTVALSGELILAWGRFLLLYTSGVPAFTVVSGVLLLETNTIFKINNTGAQLGFGSYKLISASSGGLVSGIGLLLVTVSGGGVVSGAIRRIKTFPAMSCI